MGRAAGLCAALTLLSRPQASVRELMARALQLESQRWAQDVAPQRLDGHCHSELAIDIIQVCVSAGVCSERSRLCQRLPSPGLSSPLPPADHLPGPGQGREHLPGPGRADKARAAAGAGCVPEEVGVACGCLQGWGAGGGPCGHFSQTHLCSLASRVGIQATSASPSCLWSVCH